MAKNIYTIMGPSAESPIIDGALCIILYPKDNSWKVGETVEDTNVYFKGACISRKNNAGRFSCMLNGTEYIFNGDGVPSNTAAVGFRLYLAALNKESSAIGNVIGDIAKVVQTRNADGSVTTKDAGKMSVSIENLNARDQFALQILQGFLEHVSDPASLGSDQIAYYCNAAYTWASYMMTTAAGVRATVMNEGDEDGERSVNPEDLETNTEILLQNIITEMARANLTEGENGNETTSRQVTVLNIGTLSNALNNMGGELSSLTTKIGDQKDVLYQGMGGIKQALASNAAVISGSINKLVNSIGSLTEIHKDMLDEINGQLSDMNDNLKNIANKIESSGSSSSGGSSSGDSSSGGSSSGGDSGNSGGSGSSDSSGNSTDSSDPVYVTAVIYNNTGSDITFDKKVSFLLSDGDSSYHKLTGLCIGDDTISKGGLATYAVAFPGDQNPEAYLGKGFAAESVYNKDYRSNCCAYINGIGYTCDAKETTVTFEKDSAYAMFISDLQKWTV